MVHSAAVYTNDARALESIQKLFAAWGAGLLADMIAASGKSAEAGELLDGAFIHIERTGLRWSEAEIWRQKGMQLLASGPRV